MMPYLLKNTGLQIESWYFFVVAGFLIALFFGVIKTPREDFPMTPVGSFFLGILMAYFGIIGAKTIYIFLYWKSFTGLAGTNIFDLYSSAGYSSAGSFLFQVFSIYLFTKIRIRRISFLKIADYAMPFALLVQAYIRIGCFSGGCCYGKPTDLPWGCVFPGVTEVAVHPTQLYSMGYLFLIFFVMRHMYKKNPPVGGIFFGTLFLYAICRFFNEFLRVDSINLVGILSLAQVAMISTACISGIGLGIVLIKRRRS